jgi:hypothetical protein
MLPKTDEMEKVAEECRNWHSVHVRMSLWSKRGVRKIEHLQPVKHLPIGVGDFDAYGLLALYEINLPTPCE